MNEIARRWRVLAGGAAAGVAAVVGFAGATASAEPVFPQPPLPVPATVTQTVTVAPDAAATAPQALGQPAVTPATPALAGHLDAGRPRPAAGNDHTGRLGHAGRLLQGEGRRTGAAEQPRLQGAQHRAADAEGLVAGARPECSRRVRGDRRPGRRQRPVLDQRAGRGLQADRRLRPEGGHQPRLHRQPAAARLAGHRRVARRLRRHAVVGHRGHLPRELDDAEHVAAPRHRHRGP